MNMDARKPQGAIDRGSCPVGLRIRAAYKEKYGTREKFLRESGLARSTVIDWEKGRSTPGGRNAEKAAAALGIPIDELFGRERGPTVSPDSDIRDILGRIEERLIALDRKCEAFFRPDETTRRSAARRAS